MWLCLKQGYQKFQFYLNSTSIYRLKFAHAWPWKPGTFYPVFSAYEYLHDREARDFIMGNSRNTPYDKDMIFYLT